MDYPKILPAPLGRLHGLWTLMRPRQWVKNGFVLAPLLFSSRFLEPSDVSHALLAAVLFCLASSAAYIVNDIHDMERDRLHPSKSGKRPLAAGIISLKMAWLLLAMLYGLFVGCWFVAPEIVPVIVAYLLLNLAYTFLLQDVPVVDIFCIATGFVLRVYAGAAALAVALSSWMFVTTLCLALYLAAVKRRQELIGNSLANRKVLQKYSVGLIDRYAEMSASGAVVFYSLFVMSSRPQLILTIPLVLFGLFRYWYVVERLEGGESPTDVLLTDWPLLITVTTWIGVCAWALWPGES
jgi:4-hydroxybenzoate polyprenyltransferase